MQNRSATEKVKNSTMLVDGHCGIGLPFRRRKDLQNNQEMVLHRLAQLKRRFLRQPELFSACRIAIRSYAGCGYMADVARYQLQPGYLSHWYTPHLAVRNSKKPGKVRVVYHCTARSHDFSLNDFLFQGPNIVDVLLRFLEGKVAPIADIRKIFLQINIPGRKLGTLRILRWPRLIWEIAWLIGCKTCLIIVKFYFGPRVLSREMLEGCVPLRAWTNTRRLANVVD